MRKAAAGLRLPTRTCNTHRRPSSTVNSMSHMSRNRRSKVSACCCSASYACGISVRNAVRCEVARLPLTTSSPWAFAR
jgi:hypothetical protein